MTYENEPHERRARGSRTTSGGTRRHSLPHSPRSGYLRHSRTNVTHVALGLAHLFSSRQARSNSAARKEVLQMEKTCGAVGMVAEMNSNLHKQSKPTVATGGIQAAPSLQSRGTKPTSSREYARHHDVSGSKPHRVGRSGIVSWTHVGRAR